MTIFEKKRLVISLIRKWFPTTPIYFWDDLEGYSGGTQWNEWGQLEYFVFNLLDLLDMGTVAVTDLALHEVAHGLDNSSGSGHDGHTDEWLEIFYKIGGTHCWSPLWEWRFSKDKYAK